MGDAQMSRATDPERDKFKTMLDCMSDMELARPYIIMESAEGKSYNELAIKYDLSKEQIRYIIKCGKNSHSLSQMKH